MAAPGGSVLLGFRRAVAGRCFASSLSSPSALHFPSPSSSCSSSSSSCSSSSSSRVSASRVSSSRLCSSCFSASLGFTGRREAWRRRSLLTRTSGPASVLCDAPHALAFPSVSSLPVSDGGSNFSFRLACGFSSTPGRPASPGEAVHPGEKVEKEKPVDLPLLFDGGEERLSPQQVAEKEQLIKELTQRLSGPLADSNGNVPTGAARPIAIEVDGPTHFYANSTRYTAYTKLKHRLLTRMGYKVLHVPYFEWRRLRGQKEREEYMRRKLMEEPTEWLDPEDEKFYNERMKVLKQQYEEEARRAAGLGPVSPTGEAEAVSAASSASSQMPETRISPFESSSLNSKTERERDTRAPPRSGEGRERTRENSERRPQFSPPVPPPPPPPPQGRPPYQFFSSSGPDGVSSPFHPPPRPPPPSAPGRGSPGWPVPPYGAPHPPYAQGPPAYPQPSNLHPHTQHPHRAPYPAASAPSPPPLSPPLSPPPPLSSPPPLSPSSPPPSSSSDAGSMEETIAQIKQKQDELAKMLAKLKSLEQAVGKNESEALKEGETPGESEDR
ncbi:UNVERIFIED_CONTAM: RAP domain-containing protein [Hammondia hammondi]|eukprot:XP_008884158.1 RAP domain-containing protein [Hammondia hammondi]